MTSFKKTPFTSAAVALFLCVTAQSSFAKTEYAFSLVTGLDSFNAITNDGSILGKKNNQAAILKNGSVTLLGTLGSDQRYTTASGMNNAGQIVGSSVSKTNDATLTIWDANTGNTLTQVPGMSGVGISDAGVVVGNTKDYAATWNGSTITALGTVPDGVSSRAAAISSSGLVAGTAYTEGDMIYRAVIWNGTSATQLPALPDYWSTRSNYAGAHDINNAGTVVGVAERWDAYISWDPFWGPTDFFTRSAVAWKNGQLINLGGLPTGGSTYSEATAVNNADQIVGNSEWNNGVATNLHGIPYPANSTWELYSGANAINNAGQIVGYSDTLSPYGRLTGRNTRAVLWNDTTAIDLNAFIDSKEGFLLKNAVDINDRGQILVTGINNRTYANATFLLTPVPEPETYALMLGGLGLVGFIARRRKVA